MSDTHYNNNKNSTSTIDLIKAWVSPALISIIGLLLWRDLSEMRQDIRVLLSNQSVVAVRVDHLEKVVEDLQDEVKILSRFQTSTYETNNYNGGSTINPFIKGTMKKEDEIKLKKD